MDLPLTVLALLRRTFTEEEVNTWSARGETCHNTLTEVTGEETASNALDGSLVQWKSRSLCLLCRLSFSLHSTRKCIHTAAGHCGEVWVRTWMCICLVVYFNHFNPSSLVFVLYTIPYTIPQHKLQLQSNVRIHHRWVCSLIGRALLH